MDKDLNNTCIILTPVYEDADSYRMLLKDLANTLEMRVYMVVVDDGSIHHPVEAKYIDEA